MTSRYARSRVGFVVALAASTASAQANRDVPATDTLIARKLFREAGELRDRADWSGAVDKLRQVIDIKETAGVRLHLAHALAKVGHFVEALESLGRAEKLNDAVTFDGELEKAIAKEREEIQAVIPTIEIRCAEPCEVRAVVIDRKRVAQPPDALYVDPGTHAVEVYASGHAPFVTEVTARERDRVAITPVWPDIAPAQTPTRAPARARGGGREEKPSHAKTYVILGEGAFALTGIVLGLAFRSAATSAEGKAIYQRARLTGDCGKPSPGEVQLCADLADNVDSRDRNDRLATISFIGAGVGLGAMVATELLWPKAGRKSARMRPQFLTAETGAGFQLGVRGVLE